MYRRISSFLIPLIVLHLAVLAPLVEAEDVTTIDGKTYTNLKVTGETTDGVKILHDGGISTVKKANLPQAFLELHGMAGAPSMLSVTDTNAGKQLIANFIASFPMLQTRDGRVFKSSEISAVEPSGLKLTTESGLVRVKFTELPEKVRAAFNYDPLAAASFERDKESQRVNSADRDLKHANAASFVDASSRQVRMYLNRNEGTGWLCDMLMVADRESTVTTSRPGSPLSGPKVIYESQTVREQVVTGALIRVMVFGLPDYNAIQADHNGRRVWSGKAYAIGICAFEGLAGEAFTVLAMHVDRAKAIDLVMEHGANRVYAKGGAPVPARTGTVEEPGNGTGFAITDDGYLATSAHVVAGTTSLEVWVAGRPVPAKVVALDEPRDLAIIHVPGLETIPLSLTEADDLPLGQSLFVVGFPKAGELGTNIKLTRGDLSSLAKDSTDKSLFQMSVPIQGGNSGGPVCVKTGQVAGVVKSTQSTLMSAMASQGAVPQNLNFAVRATLLRDLARTVPQVRLSKDSMPEPGQSFEDFVVKSTYLITTTKNVTVPLRAAP